MYAQPLVSSDISALNESWRAVACQKALRPTFAAFALAYIYLRCKDKECMEEGKCIPIYNVMYILFLLYWLYFQSCSLQY